MSDVNLEQDDQRFDALLTRHLSAELDGQLGRALPHFRRHVAAEQSRGAADATRALTLPYSGQQSWWARRGPWVMGTVGSALAASLAVLFLVPALTQPGSSNTTGPIINSGADPIPVLRVNETVHSQFYDGGTFVTPDGTPVRRYRRLNLHERHWRDAQHDAEIQEIVPSEDELYFELKTY